MILFCMLLIGFIVKFYFNIKIVLLIFVISVLIFVLLLQKVKEVCIVLGILYCVIRGWVQWCLVCIVMLSLFSMVFRLQGCMLLMMKEIMLVFFFVVLMICRFLICFSCFVVQISSLCLCWLILLQFIFCMYFIVFFKLMMFEIFGVLVLNLCGNLLQVVFLKVIVLIILFLLWQGGICFSYFFLLYSILIFVGLNILCLEKV